MTHPIALCMIEMLSNNVYWIVTTHIMNPLKLNVFMQFLYQFDVGFKIIVIQVTGRLSTRVRFMILGYQRCVGNENRLVRVRKWLVLDCWYFIKTFINHIDIFHYCFDLPLWYALICLSALTSLTLRDRWSR